MVTKNIRTLQVEAEKLLERVTVEVQEITTEIMTLQEAQWLQIKAVFPEIDTALRQWIN